MGNNASRETRVMSYTRLLEICNTGSMDKLIAESDVHSAVIASCLENLYAARRIVDLSAETTKDDTLYEANSHLDTLAATLNKLLK